MALNASIMGAAMRDAVHGVPFSPDPSAYSLALATAQAQAIIDHFQRYGQVFVVTAALGAPSIGTPVPGTAPATNPTTGGIV